MVLEGGGWFDQQYCSYMTGMVLYVHPEFVAQNCWVVILVQSV